jgi:hypothetical protein
MTGLSLAILRCGASLDRAPLHLYLVLFVLMDKKSHGRQDLAIIIGLGKRCVDDMVVEKPV